MTRRRKLRLLKIGDGDDGDATRPHFRCHLYRRRIAPRIRDDDGGVLRLNVFSLNQRARQPALPFGASAFQRAFQEQQTLIENRSDGCDASRAKERLFGDKVRMSRAEGVNYATGVERVGDQTARLLDVFSLLSLNSTQDRPQSLKVIFKRHSLLPFVLFASDEFRRIALKRERPAHRRATQQK